MLLAVIYIYQALYSGLSDKMTQKQSKTRCTLGSDRMAENT